MFDVPHIFKHFLKNNFKFNGQKVSFSDIKLDYNIDTPYNTSRAFLNSTDNYKKPNPS